MKDTSEIYYNSIESISKLIADRKISPIELMDIMATRIENLAPQLNCYSYLDLGGAKEKADFLAKNISSKGLSEDLYGIPLAVKDLFDISGVPTQAGMRIGEKVPKKYSSTVVKKIEASSAIILGKLEMTEGAFATHHPMVVSPVNPWNKDHWTGASSSGNGVAVAAGLCFGAVGTDTGGSVRFPAAANGLTSIKPTFGRVSRSGCFSFAPFFDHVGPMARNVVDAFTIFSTISGYDSKDCFSLKSIPFNVPSELTGFKGIKVGIDERWLFNDVEETLANSLRNVIDVIKSLGGKIVDIKFPDTFEISSIWERMAGVQAAVVHKETFPSRAKHYGDALRRIIEEGRKTSATAYQNMLLNSKKFSHYVDLVFSNVDMVLAPVYPYSSPTNEQLSNLALDPDANTKLIQYTAPFNISGHPCLSLPCGFTQEGMPIGCQFISGRNYEHILYQSGVAYQLETDWHCYHPDFVNSK